MEIDWETFFSLPKLAALGLTEQNAHLRLVPPSLITATLSELAVGARYDAPTADWIGLVDQPEVPNDLQVFAASLGWRRGYAGSDEWRRNGTVERASNAMSDVYLAVRAELTSELEVYELTAAEALSRWRALYKDIDRAEERERAVLSSREMWPSIAAVLFAATSTTHPWGVVRGPSALSETEECLERGMGALWDAARVGSVQTFGRPFGKGALEVIPVKELRDLPSFKARSCRVHGVNDLWWSDVHFDRKGLRGTFSSSVAQRSRLMELAKDDLLSLTSAWERGDGPKPAGVHWRERWQREVGVRGALDVWREVGKLHPKLRSPEGTKKTKRPS